MSIFSKNMCENLHLPLVICTAFVPRLPRTFKFGRKISGGGIRVLLSCAKLNKASFGCYEAPKPHDEAQKAM